MMNVLVVSVAVGTPVTVVPAKNWTVTEPVEIVVVPMMRS